MKRLWAAKFLNAHQILVFLRLFHKLVTVEHLFQASTNQVGDEERIKDDNSSKDGFNAFKLDKQWNTVKRHS